MVKLKCVNAVGVALITLEIYVFEAPKQVGRLRFEPFLEL